MLKLYNFVIYLFSKIILSILIFKKVRVYNLLINLSVSNFSCKHHIPRNQCLNKAKQVVINQEFIYCKYKFAKYEIFLVSCDKAAIIFSDHFLSLRARSLSVSFFITFAHASSKSSYVTWILLSLKANIPASVHTALLSAPDAPGIYLATL